MIVLKRLFSRITLMLSVVFLMFDKAFASTWFNPGGAAGTFESYIKKVFNWLVLIAGVIFIIMFLIGGIQYLTSAGNEEAAGKAKKLLIDAVIGIIITTGAYVAGSYVIGQIGGTAAF